MGPTREGVPKLFNTSGSQPVRIDFRDCLCRGNDVKRNLKLMIKRGMATNTAIDEQNNRVVSAMAGSVAAPAGNRQVPGPQAVAYQQHATPEMVVVECPSCGAKNSIPRGAIAQCGHCGAQIDAR